MLFIGVMSCMYALWDVVGKYDPLVQHTLYFNTCADDTIARKVNTSDASQFAKICGCFPSQGIIQYPVGEAEFMTVNSVGRYLAYRGYCIFCAWNHCRTSCI